MKIVFRTDASHQIGTGHVIRCLTLAKALRQRGAKCKFVCRALEGNLLKRIQQEDFEVFALPQSSIPNSTEKTHEKLPAHSEWLGAGWQTDAEQTIAALDNIRPDWLVVDHYSLDASWNRELRPYCAKILVIDDIADRDHDCDLLLDQNLVANMSQRYDMRVPAHCGRMLGTDYALLQPQYAELCHRTPPRMGPIHRILVFVGGTDNYNLTGRAISAFLSLKRPDISLDVVINPASRHAMEIHEQARTHVGITLYETLPSLAPLMLKADLAIGAGGATSWERCCLGLPSIVVTLAENQTPIAAELNRQGYIRWLGHQDNVNESTLKTALQDVLEGDCLADWSLRCMELVDGRGTERVATILSLNPETDLKVRFAQLNDEALLLHWANDPLVRQNAFNPTAIDSESHRCWFHKRLRNPENYKIYIVEAEGILPIGVVRFEKIGHDWEIHYSLSSLARSRGIGLPMLKTALTEFRKTVGQDNIFGRVKIENKASQQIFKKLGFAEMKSDFELTYRFPERV